MQNNCFIMPPGPEGQEFVWDIAGMTWLYSTMFGVSARKTQMSMSDLNGWGLEEMSCRISCIVVFSLTYLPPGPGWLGACIQLRLSIRTPACGLDFSQGGSWVLRGNLHRGQARSCLAFYDSDSLSSYSSGLGIHKPIQIQGVGRRLHFSGQLSKNGRQHVLKPSYWLELFSVSVSYLRIKMVSYLVLSSWDLRQTLVLNINPVNTCCF